MKKQTPGLELKQKNRNNIYRFIHMNQYVTKQDLVKELNLSLPTVTQNLSDLLEEKLITESGSFGNTGGRRARGYTIVPDARVAVGADINRNSISIVVADLKGSILACKNEYRAFDKNEEYYRRIYELIEAALEQCHIRPEYVLGVGISVQGIVSPDNQYVIYGEAMGITGETVSNIGQYVPYPKSLYHDSDMAAFAELWGAHDIEDAVYISLSTNMGGAVINQRRIHPHSAFGIGRIEHMTLLPGGKRCYCGQQGCAEVYCTAAVLSSMTENDRLDSFFIKLKNGDEGCKKAFDEYLDSLSIVINNTRVMFDCEIILGGYMGEYLEEYLDELKARTYSRNSFDRNADYIKLCRVKKEPIAVGAALQYIDSFIGSI